MALRGPSQSPGRLQVLLGGIIVILLVTIYGKLNEQSKALRAVAAVQQRLAAAAAAAQASTQQQAADRAATGTQLAASSADAHAAAVPRKDAKPIPQLQHRTDLAALLESEGLKTGAELGVLFGDFAEHNLNIWKGCTTYYLIDLWAQQENYKDLANSNDKEQENRFQNAQTRLAPFKDKAVFKRMYTTEAAKQIPDNSLDFVYVDARHDYCGVMEDLEAYWPKLRSGAIFSGHDYIDAHAKALKDTNQDWSVCGNGTINFGAVKGAVDEFAAKHGLTIVATTGDGDWPTWMARKP